MTIYSIPTVPFIVIIYWKLQSLLHFSTSTPQSYHINSLLLLKIKTIHYISHIHKCTLCLYSISLWMKQNVSTGTDINITLRQRFPSSRQNTTPSHIHSIIYKTGTNCFPVGHRCIENAFLCGMKWILFCLSMVIFWGI